MDIPKPGTSTTFSSFNRWMAQHPYWTLTAITLLIFGPFLAKPFNIDDPLFILSAHQIQAHPTDPYGFKINWATQAIPMWELTENPPLACYYLAGAAALVGWSEPALHLAMLLPVLAAVWGMYRLARHFCSHPLLAVLAMLSTPSFLVSGLTIMCDMTMVAFWIWAVIFWVEGSAQDKVGKLFIAGCLITLAEVTKYYGACLVPLLAAYSLAGRRPARRWAPCLLVPLGALVIYHLAGKVLYGESLLGKALSHATLFRNLAGFSETQTILITLVFAGGCTGAATLFAPLLWRGQMLAAGLVVVVVVAILVLPDEALWKHYEQLAREGRMIVVLQMALWATGGSLLILLAAMDLWRQQDAASVLLGGWVLGTLVFVAFFNWTVNARTLLPIAPPIGILIARRLEFRGMLNGGDWRRNVWICLVASLVLALAVLQGDYLLAVATRQNARQVADDFKNQPGNLWFEGHWGFQYYMSTTRAKAMDFSKLSLRPGDTIAIPSHNSNIRLPVAQTADLVEVYTLRGPWMVTTCNQNIGAGFYSSSFGPLPFAFGSVPPETVSIYSVKPSP